MTRLPLFEPCFRYGRKGQLRVIPWMDDPSAIVLFGGFGHHVDRDIFAAKLAVVESDAAVGGGEQRVVLAHADVGAGVPLGAALANDDVARDDALTAGLFDAEAASSRIAAVTRGAACFLMCHGGLPLALLLANTFLPFAVSILLIKPCLFLLFLLDG